MRLYTLGLTAVALIGIALGSWSLSRIHDLDSAANAQRGRTSELSVTVDHLRHRRVVVDTSRIEWRIDQCEAKLADVRHVLEVLIRTEQATGRARWNLEALPRPMSDWPPWPCRGENIGSITENRHPCDRELGGGVW